MKGRLDTRAISRFLLAGMILVLIALSAATFYIYYQNSSGKSTSQSTNNTSSIIAIIAPIAVAHWTAIGSKNVSAIMSGYTSNYEALWWFVNGSVLLSGLNGRHDCNKPTGNNNCSEDLSSVWETFALNTPEFNYMICPANYTLGVQDKAFALTTIWYFSARGNETIRVPFETDFDFFNGQWTINRDWFGQPYGPALILPGDVQPKCIS